MDHHLSHLSTRFKTPDPQSTRKRSGSQMQERQDRFFIKTLSPFLIQSGMRRAVGGKPVIRGYWIVIGCNAGQGSYNAGQGSNRILPNCPFCHRHKPSCSVSSSVGDEQNTSHNLSFADQFRRWGVAKFPKVETMEMVIQILFIQTR